jgi:predicted O-methyltransferase YrrM
MWLKSLQLRNFFLTRFSRPASYRPIYQAIRRDGLRRIVEVGVGSGERALRMIEAAGEKESAENVVYTGIDLFEMRTAQDGEGLSLKEAHRKLIASGAKIRLLPGDAYSALSRAANMLGLADLIVISYDQDASAVARSWYYLERLLQGRTQIFWQENGTAGLESAFRVVERREVQQWAAAAAPHRRRAA